MSTPQSFAPLPPLPLRVAQLNTLAYNLWWSWNPLARALFQTIDAQRWQSVAHNPVLALHLASPARLAALSQDPTFLAANDPQYAATTFWDHAIASFKARIAVRHGPFWLICCKLDQRGIQLSFQYRDLRVHTEDKWLHPPAPISRINRLDHRRAARPCGPESCRRAGRPCRRLQRSTAPARPCRLPWARRAAGASPDRQPSRSLLRH